MADDIDIEEHDVLDNPVIRNIFPDITVIKKEISQYYEDVLDIKQEPEANKPDEDSCKDQSHASSVTAGPYNICDFNVQGDSVKSVNKDDNTKPHKPLHTNKIILGSKPPNIVQSKAEDNVNSKKQTKEVIRVPKVILQDLGAYICRNNRYCSDCQILFPSRSDCEDHKRKLHSTPIKTRNKQLNVSVSLEKPSLEHKSQSHKCNICGSYFSSSSNLSKHMKNFHKKKTTFNSNYKKVKHHTVRIPPITKKVHSQKKKGNLNIKVNVKTAKCSGSDPVVDSNTLAKLPLKSRKQCNICGSQFTRSDSLARHYNIVHKKKVAFRLKNKCNTYKHSNDLSISAETTHSRRNQRDKNEKNKCFHCKELFPDQKTLVEHIYEVLEPKRYPKRQQNKKVNVTITKQPQERRSSKKEINKEAELRVNNKQNKISSPNYGKMESSSKKKQYKYSDTEINENHKPKVGLKENQNVNITHSKNNQPKRKHVDSDMEDNQASEPYKKNTDYSPMQYSKSDRKRRKLATQTLRSKLIFESEVSDDDHYISNEESNEPHENENLVIKDKQNDNECISTSKEQSQRVNITTNSNKDSSDLNIIGNQIQCENEDIKTRSKAYKEENKIKKTCEPTLKKKQIENSKDLSDEDLPLSKTMQIKAKQSVNSDREINVNSNKNKLHNTTGKYVYECLYCSYMFRAAKSYHRHSNVKHKVKEVPSVNKVTFNEQCKYCPSKNRNVEAHNLHLFRFHYDLVYKNFPGIDIKPKIEKAIKLKNPAFRVFESFVLKSIIYKCYKCDIHFLSSYIAKDHVKHMELLVHWKCSLCKRIFKKHDKLLHLKQHNFSKQLNVCQFNETELSTLLYNCTKCAIHFKEKRYLEHYSKCDEETTDSVYCKSCDILIDKLGYKNHESYHTQGKNINDFTVIVADIIEVTEKSKERDIEVRKRKRRYEQMNCLTYCQTCNTYLSDLALSRKSHTEARCSEIPKYTCQLCGLVLTNKALGTHRDHHKIKRDLKLQDFKFFNLQGIQINPPIPNYPQCNNCEVHFVGRNAVKTHICSEIEYMTCNICKIKLSENAFKLHMNFHNYSMLKAHKGTTQHITTSEHSEEQKIESNGDLIDNLKTSTLSYEYKNKQEDHSSSDNFRNYVIFICRSCKIAVDGYDKVIEHCQNHYSPTPIGNPTWKTCSKCSLNIESELYVSHQRLHSHDDVNIILTFDPMYFTSDNNTWIQHVFRSAPQHMQKNIVGESIYQYECRIKMKVVQKGPPYLTVYKCDKCGNFIDPDYLFAHVKDECPKNIRKHPCSTCGLPFITSVFRNKHEKIHRRYDNVRIKSYNLVLINCEMHNTYSANILNAMKQYVLYQCRTCNGVVDKWQRNSHQCNTNDLIKCSKCRLLIYKTDFESHACKHNDLVEFQTTNMKVILFGEKKDLNENKILLPSFEGKIHDYTLYKCAQCEICVHNMPASSRHVCKYYDTKWKCPKCDFYICVKLSLNQHLKIHDADPEFNADNIKVIHFNEGKGVVNQTVENTTESMESNDDINDTQNSEQESNADCVQFNANLDEIKPNSDTGNLDVDDQVEESTAIYKCSCGLNFINESNAKVHVKNCNPKDKVVRQCCSKCTMLFNPKELFCHLIAHHSDKNKTYKYEVIEIKQ